MNNSVVSKLFLNVNYTVIFFPQFHFYIPLTILASRKFLNNPEDNVYISQDSRNRTIRIYTYEKIHC